MSNSKPVGFRIPNPVHEFYDGRARADRRELGPYLRNVLEDVRGIVQACEVLGISPNDILRRAELDEHIVQPVNGVEPPRVRVTTGAGEVIQNR